MAGITKRAYRDPFSGHVITVTAQTPEDEREPARRSVNADAPSAASPTQAPSGPDGPGDPEAYTYSEEEDRVNRCIAGVRRGRI